MDYSLTKYLANIFAAISICIGNSFRVSRNNILRSQNQIIVNSINREKTTKNPKVCTKIIIIIIQGILGYSLFLM